MIFQENALVFPGLKEYLHYLKQFKMTFPKGKLSDTRFLCYKQRFFSPQPQCCLILSWIEPQMLRSCCLIYNNHHYTETHFIFSLFGSMSRPTSIYVVSL